MEQDDLTDEAISDLFTIVAGSVAALDQANRTKFWDWLVALEEQSREDLPSSRSEPLRRLTVALLQRQELVIDGLLEQRRRWGIPLDS